MADILRLKPYKNDDFGVYSAEFGCVRLTDASVASESLAGRKVATTFIPSRAPDTVRCQVKRR